MALTERLLLRSPVFAMSAEQFAARTPQDAWSWGLIGLYLGDQPGSERYATNEKYLSDFRLHSTPWPKKQNPYVPMQFSRVDLISFADEPDQGSNGDISDWFDYLMWIPQQVLDDRIAFNASFGWTHEILEPYASWMPTEMIGGVAHQPMPYLPDTTGSQPRTLSWQTATLDPVRTAGLQVNFLIETCAKLGLTRVGIGNKRAYYSPRIVDGGPIEWKFDLPGPDDAGLDHARSFDGTYFVRPPTDLEPAEYTGAVQTKLGTWDEMWCVIVRGLIAAGIEVIVSHERPKGFPDQSGTAWLPADLLAQDGVMLFEDPGPEEL